MYLIREASLALALLTVAGMAAPALAGGNSLYVESRNHQFGVLNPTTGAYTLIGTTTELIGGLGFAANGQLYGLGEDSTGSLFAINATTAALTFIGNTGVPTAGSAGYSFCATSDGTFYADSNGKSYQINPATGAATLLGSLGFTSTGGLSGDDKGNLYLTGGSQNQGLYQVNRTTGQGTLIGTSTYGTVYGLADTGGTLYGVNTTGSVFSVNTTTAAGTLTATYNVVTAGTVYAAAAQLSPAPVPEASTTLSLGLLLMLGLGGAVVSARRRKASSTL